MERQRRKIETAPGHGTANSEQRTANSEQRIVLAVAHSVVATPGEAHDVAMVDAVVFDLDVVLVDSEPIWEGVRRRYVADTGGRWLPDSQQRLMGMSTSEWGGVSQRRARRGANVVADMVSRYQAGVPLIPGAASIVRALAQHWPLGLASSSPPALIDGCCKYPLCKQMSAQSRTGR